MRWGVSAVIAAAMGIALLGAGAPAGAAPGGGNERPELRTVSILGVGDILVHRQILDQARYDGGGGVDFRPQLNGIAHLVASVDLAVCHMEYPMGKRSGPWSVWPKPVNAPPQLADALADIGFDACSTASNHSLAQGMTGVRRTIAALEAAGLAHAGTARKERESRIPTIVEANGVRVGLLSYTYGFNGYPRPYAWCCNLIDAERIIADARASRKAGAEIVVVSLHDGVEGIVRPTYSQRTVVGKLAASGLVDLVLGHHAHLVQPVTRVQGMWVAYGHGNLLSAQSRKDPRTGDGLLTRFTFAERRDGSFHVVAAEGFALRNRDYPFRVAAVPTTDRTSGSDEATWNRVRNQALLLDGGRGFRLLRDPGR